MLNGRPRVVQLTERAGWNQTYDTNVTGTHFVTAAFAPLLLACRTGLRYGKPAPGRACSAATGRFGRWRSCGGTLCNSGRQTRQWTA
ncbi:hypothetical protein PG997_014040 [Apiospora hydei]|uniref:Uncharacterized protein n=1 Tax=Apiospora hydei TaxID=1337664 RepID=A0ABR1VBI8_9PEZI